MKSSIQNLFKDGEWATGNDSTSDDAARVSGSTGIA